MKIEETFLENIRERTSIKKGDKIIIALSGGQDSVLLLYLFLKYREELNIKVVVAHINHLLRGEESDKDQNFVTALAEKNGLELFILRKKVKELARENSWSLEEAGRIVRYNYLNNLLREEKAQKIAVAHHLKDQGETILFHLIRGSGVKGFRGMFFEKGDIIRPLLNISKEEIEEYCTSNSLEYREDLSNYSDSYTRNKIRLQLLPALKEYNPQIESQLYKLGEIIKEEDAFMEEAMKKAYEGVAVPNRSSFLLKEEEFLSFHKALRRRIIIAVYEKLTNKYLEFKYIEKIERYLNRDRSKKLSLPNQAVFYYDRYKGVFILAVKERKTEEKREYVVVENMESYAFNEGKVTFKKLLQVNEYILRNSTRGYVNFHKLKFPLTIRNLRENDRFKVVGEKKERNLKRLLASRGYGYFERGSLPIVVDASGQVVFVPFIGVSSYFILEGGEEAILDIEYNK